ncbi:MAG TPA: UvrD-helicase domain-containing protein [Rhodocyclaceae bacterium]
MPESMCAGMPTLADDAAARERALEPGSFIVEAPAGAGKTELLTQRFLALLARVESPEEVVAITFTRKAAAEMRGRIVDNLIAAASAPRPDAPHRARTWELARQALAHGAARGWGLERQPARLRVLTIDALCMLLARQAPLLSQIGGIASVSDDSDALYAEAARRSLALLEGDDTAHADCVAAALAHLDNDAGRLQRLLAAMLARRDQWLPHGRPVEAGVGNRAALAVIVEAALADVASTVDGGAQAALMPLFAEALANAPEATAAQLAPLAEWQPLLVAAWDELPRWQALARWLLTQKGEFRKRWTANEGFPAGKAGQGAKAAIGEWIAALPVSAEAGLAAVQALPTPEDAAADLPLVEALARLLWLAVAQLWLVFGETREVDFIAVAEAALRALGERDAPSDLALDYRITHLLVDEFQDTSPSQVELLQRLTAGWGEAEGDERTLFCVGDPMQSIYRFRKAEVGLFIEARRRGIGSIRLAPLQLARNNRSDEGLVDWINATLPAAFASADDPLRGAIAYRRFVATREGRPGSGAFWHPLVCERGVPASAVATAEAGRIIALVDELRASDGEREIAVLVRARSHLTALVAQLRRNRPDLPFEAVEIDSLESRQWVRDLIILASALGQLADRVNWLALLRSPLCGLTLVDLHALAAGTGRTSPWALLHDDARLATLSADGRERALALRVVIGEALAHAGRQRRARWVEGVWLALGGAATVPDEAALADCRACFDLIEHLSAAGRFDLDTLPAEVGKLFAAADPRGAGRLTLMTIHKAKGLEFDTVILPGLQRAPGGFDDPPLLRWESVIAEDGTRHTAVAALPPREGAGGEASYRLLERLERDRGRAEAARVLYVGATRAKRALHLFASVWQSADGEALAPPRGESLLGFLWPAVAEEWAALPVDLAADAAAAGAAQLADFVPPLRRLSSAGFAARLSATLPGDVDAGSGCDDSAAARDQAVMHRIDWGRGANAREGLIGTLTHRYLERIAVDGLAAWPAERFDGLHGAMRDWLVREGLPPIEAAASAAEVAAMLRLTRQSADGQRVLRAKGDAELALVSEDADGARVQVVDRSFIDGGVRWVVDYKTEAVGDGNFTAAAARHREQLARYAKLFAGESRPIRCAVFFVRYGRLESLSDE